ncbi:MAG: hypothetical protein M1820_004476 [Bogoriella megaspora]|nr:MAG: hypothetical protein M1820_004476 [Bogoriella megaspora]
MASTTGFQPQPSWGWPGDLPSDLPGQWTQDSEENPRQNHADSPQASSPNTEQPHPNQGQSEPHAGQRRYGPRTCRICLDVVQPTYHPPSMNLPGILRTAPEVTYESEDGGRLLRPCKCKGSSKYVHEECLQAWRLQNPLERRNYWQCPTCGFRYRLQRMSWAKWIGSASAQIALTIFIFIFAMFLLGFIADPIINLYLDPYGTIFYSTFSGNSEPEFLRPSANTEPSTWGEHFLGGLASLGLLSFLKIFITSPWRWWNFRAGSFGSTGSRAGASGRDRMQNLSWIVIAIGVATFMWGVWKGVRSWSRRLLQNIGERVMDVGPDDDEDDH